MISEMKKTIVVFITFLALFTFRLTQTSTGLTVDELAFAKNAKLIAETGKDENERFLPIFVLSHAGQDGEDWRQPYTQYLTVAVFKLFGASVFNLKIGSAILAALSTSLIFFLGQVIWKRWQEGIIPAVFLASSPVVMMHAHLGLDPIMVVPFVCLWLITIWYKSWTWSGFMLGLNYYAYRGMRAVVPIWTVFSVWGAYQAKKLLPLILVIISFVVMIPLLEWKYSGAVLNKQGAEDSIYDFAYYYLGSFDPSVMWIKGDEQLFHTTGQHGMFLLASLPWFAIGMYTAIKKKEFFWLVVVAAWWFGPILYGLIGSTHRGHRLIFLAPLYALVASLGFTQTLRSKHKLVRKLHYILLIAMVANWWDFASYYWFRYSADTANIFYPYPQWLPRI